MPLISHSLPSLVGGISQQPATFRRPSQSADSLNAYSDPVTGLKKRTGTKFLKSITVPTDADYFAIERDIGERYLLAVSPAEVKVFTDAGVTRTVTGSASHPYLSGTNTYKTLTIADTTFIVNPTKIPAMKATLSPTTPNAGLIFISAVGFSNVYSIKMTGTGVAANVTHTTPASGALSVATVAAALTASLNASTGVTASSVGGVIKYTTVAPAAVEGFSSNGDAFMKVIPGQTKNFADLPAIGFPGVIIKITGDVESNADDYYVKFSETAAGNGVWRETVAPGISFEIDPATMPHVLTRQTNGTFVFGEFVWGQRITGDAESSPLPSFIGKTINNIVFHRDRLCFLSDTNTILSEANNLPNFFRTTVASVIDSDPIDLAVSGTQIDILKTVVAVKDGLLLFSDNGQFLMTAGDADILSPETASIVSVSSYKVDTSIDPTRVGDQIYFLTNRGEYLGVREYLYESGRDFTQTASITNHIPELIQGVKFIDGSSTENVVVLVSDKILYVYQYLYSGEEKIVSAWGKWDFADADILFATVFDNDLYLILGRGASNVRLEVLPLTNTFRHPSLLGELCLDEYSGSLGAAVSSTVYNGGLNQTTVTFNRQFNGAPILISGSDLPSQSILVGDVISTVSRSMPTASTYQVVLSGDWRGKIFYAGTTYSFRYTFSTPYIQLQEGDVETGGRLQVRNYNVVLNKTGDIRFRVVYNTSDISSSTNYIEDITDWSSILDMFTLETSGDAEANSYVYELSRLFPAANLTARYSQIDTTFRVPIMSQNTQFTLVAESDSWQPVTMSKVQWEAMFHKRSRLT